MSYKADLTKIIKEFYIPCEMQGIIQLTISDDIESAFFITMRDQISLEPGHATNPDATIRMPKDILEKALNNPETFEPRSRAFLDGVAISGNLNLIHYFTQLLKRPSRLINETLEEIHSRNYDAIQNIAVIDEICENKILDAIVNSYPLCIKNALQWESLDWSLDDLDEKLGHLPLRKNPLTGKEEYFSDFVQLLKQDEGTERLYTNGFALPESFYKYFTFPFFKSDHFRPIQIWLGKKRENKLITKLHCDFVTSFLGQIWGRKKIYLYAPDQHPYLYTMKSYNVYQPCFVDPASPNYVLYPKFKKARHLEVTVEPGDILIIPAGWFHCVWALDTVFSINRFMDQKVANELQALSAPL